VVVVWCAVTADYEAKCSTGTAITLTADTGYLVNHVAFNPSTRHAACVWRVRVAPGQRIALTLYDFGRFRPRRRNAAAAASKADRGPAAEDSKLRSAARVSTSTTCRKYAVVREAGETDLFTVIKLHRFDSLWICYGFLARVAKTASSSRCGRQSNIFFLIRMCTIAVSEGM